MDRLKSKLNLSKSPDSDVLKKNIIKLQKRVPVGTSTLIIKVKTHRGDLLNEEADIRADMGHHKEQKEVGWKSNQQDKLQMEGRITHKINYMDQHSQESIP